MPPATFVQLPPMLFSSETRAPSTESRKRSTTLPRTSCPRWIERAATIFGGRFPWSCAPESATSTWPRFQLEAALEPTMYVSSGGCERLEVDDRVQVLVQREREHAFEARVARDPRSHHLVVPEDRPDAVRPDDVGDRRPPRWSRAQSVCWMFAWAIASASPSRWSKLTVQSSVAWPAFSGWPICS